MARQVSVKLSEVPEGWSEESADFVNKVKFTLLSAYKESRLIVLD
jgi:hypothetical protein